MSQPLSHTDVSIVFVARPYNMLVLHVSVLNAVLR